MTVLLAKDQILKRYHALQLSHAQVFLELCVYAITHCPNIVDSLFCLHYYVNNEECTNKTKYAGEYANQLTPIINTIFQRNIQYISDIKHIPWETDKYQKQKKDDNNQYIYTYIITLFTYLIFVTGSGNKNHIISRYLHH